LSKPARVETFGFNVPILIDRDGNVIAGHGRRLAACEMGMTEVPTLCLDHLTPAQSEPMIADNRLSEIATWDDAHRERRPPVGHHICRGGGFLYGVIE
jgi:ParB-like chromosome segregation protein Spo0J